VGLIKLMEYIDFEDTVVEVTDEAA